MSPGISSILIITGRNEVVAKVIFLHLFVILFTGGSASVHAGIPPPPRTRQTPPWDQADTPLPPDQTDTPQDQVDLSGTRQTPWDQADPPWTKQTPPGPGRPPRDQADIPPSGRRLQHTVYERPARILLECILVIVSELCNE